MTLATRGRHFAAALALAALTVATQARADDSPSGEAPSRPNRAMIIVGVLTLGGAFGTSAVVAGISTNPSDQRLYAPLVGPWLDIADRVKCGTGAGRVSCGIETRNEVLLVADGLFQAWGLAATIMGLFTKEYTMSGPAKAELHVAPTRLGAGGYGLGASGTF
jgi:hypothetical protein